jgi:hypothetical protein
MREDLSMKDKIIALLKEQGPLTFNEILYGTAGLHCVAPPDHVQQVIHALSDLTREGAISGIASKYQPVPSKYYTPEPTEYAWVLAEESTQ